MKKVLVKAPPSRKKKKLSVYASPCIADYLKATCTSIPYDE